MLNNPTQVARDISRWMLQELEESGQECFVVGVSGGVDSAVVYRLAQMTGKPVHPIFMPFNQRQHDDLCGLVRELTGLDVMREVEIGLWCEGIDNIFSVEETGAMGLSDLAVGNFAARMRMNFLYLMATVLKGIVVGTTNAAEWYIGYYTKYGDGGVDIEPICGLLKHEVYQLGREGFTTPVPASILNAEPSANLWKGQTDEGELGFTYDELDAWISQGVESMVPIPIIDRIVAMHHATDHKRNQPGHCCVSGQDCPVCTHLYNE